MKHFFKEALKSIYTSVLGTIAGLPQIVNGIATKDLAQVLTGAATVLIGLAAKDAHQ